jgi:hypothetical protein
MGRMRAIVNEIGPHIDASAPVEAIKPSRLNLAGRCLYCLERDCDSPRCEAMYARSRWGVCPECDGREGDGEAGVRCDWCTFGVVELAPVPSGESVGGLVGLQ